MREDNFLNLVKTQSGCEKNYVQVKILLLKRIVLQRFTNALRKNLIFARV